MSPVDPNVALLLLFTGALGIYAEFCFPGRVLPGVVGSSLAIWAGSQLLGHSVSWLGISLLATSFVLYVLEAYLRTRGILSILGALSMIAGSLFLIDSRDPALRIHPATALAALPFGFLTACLFSVAQHARRNKFK